MDIVISFIFIVALVIAIFVIICLGVITMNSGIDIEDASSMRDYEDDIYKEDSDNFPPNEII